MTQRITVGFTGADFPLLSLAIAALPTGVPFTEPVVIEVHASTHPEAIVVPSNILPTGANPLVVMSLRSDPVATPFPPFQSVIGSLAQYPAPQPRLVKATMDSLDLRADYTNIDGLKVGGDVVVTSDTGIVVDKCLILDGQVVVSRLATTPVDVRLSNIEVHRSGQKSAILAMNVTGLKVYHNSLLQRRADAATVTLPSYALEVIDSSVDAKNNVFAADGVGRSAVRFIGDPLTSTFQHNFYASFNGAKRFSFGPDAFTVTETDDHNAWKAFMTSETGSLVGDPEFRATHQSTVDDELVLTGPTPPGTYVLDHAVYDPTTLQLRAGASFTVGIPLVLGTDFLIHDQHRGEFDLTPAGVALIAAFQLWAKYNTDVDLDVSDTSPAMAMAPAIPEVKNDIRGERRPADHVTAGAHDHAEVIVDDGKKRFLELISGLSTDPVTMCVLGKSGEATLFGWDLVNDFPAQLHDDNTLDEIFQPILIEDIEVPGHPEDGLIIFRPAFQVTEPIYGQILDPVFDVVDEVGLVATDNKVFMIKRMHKIPFDACGFMFTDFQIPVEIVG